MNIQLQALIRTAKVLVTCAAISFLVTFIFANVSFETVMIVAGIVFGLLGVYVIYSISLSQIRYENKLKEMVDRK